jgi:hypothetical protein
MFTHTLRRDRKLKLRYGPRPPVTCSRQATIAYGFAGPLPDKLAGLARVLEDDGWSGWTHRWAPQEVTLAWLGAAGREASLGALWHHRPELEPLPLLRDTVPELRRRYEPTPSLSLVWTSQGEPGVELQVMLSHRRPRVSWPFRPVKFISRPGRESITSLAAAVLASREHAVVISMHVEYYQNEDARTGPGRLRKRWFPVMW